MLDTFGMHKGGKEYRRLIAAFERIFGATMFFGTEKLTSTAKVVQRSRFSFFREAQIWYNRRPDDPISSDEFANVIVLSEEFYQEAISHPIPADLEAVKLLASAPAALDLYVWLSYRCVSMLHCQRRGIRSDFRTIRPDTADRFRRVFVYTAIPSKARSMAPDDPANLA